ncbi:hypothetical protein ABZP36_027663 [Zizania latifolia]
MLNLEVLVIIQPSMLPCMVLLTSLSLNLRERNCMFSIDALAISILSPSTCQSTKQDLTGSSAKLPVFPCNYPGHGCTEKQPFMALFPSTEKRTCLLLPLLLQRHAVIN